MLKKRRLFLFVSIVFSILPLSLVKNNLDIIKKNGWVLSQTDLIRDKEYD
jgi:hypothetical protein|tara:strand:- start:239 stop:388 length:150 start_codon:yes stop_codon:yes gene_type:complete